MKTALLLSLALLAGIPAQAQIFGPRAANGVFLGGVAGAIIGRNSGSLGHNAWRGAAYGAGAGLLLGAASDRTYYWRTAGQVPFPSYGHYPRSYGSYYGYGYYGSPYYSSYGYYGRPSYYYSDYSYGRGDYAGNGLFLGALTGAIIGRNSGSLGHNAWRGAAYGAAAGYILGAIADSRVRSTEEISPQVVVTNPVAAPTVTPAPVAAPAVAPAPATPMSSANSLFGRN